MKSIDLTKTVLLVEDEAIISIVTTKAVKKAGYKVITANSGEKAVEIVSGGESIDLILMDIDLGAGIDGTETARQILSVSNIPIVFHTSHSERDMVEKVKGITRYGYVIKSSGDFVLQSSIEMAFELFDAHKNLKKTVQSLMQSDDNLQLKNQEMAELNEELNATIEELEASNEEMAQINEELIQTNKMLEEKEEDYNILFESSSSAVFIIDSGRLKIMNSMVNKILGHSSEVLTAEKFTAFIHPEDRDEAVNYYRKKLNGEKSETDHIFRIVTADGATRWISNRSVLISMNGKVTTLNYANDITDSVTAETIRVESEQRYKALFDHSPHGLVHFDINGVIKKCNSVLVGIIGSSREKLIGINMLDLPDRKLTSAIQHALRGETSDYEDTYHSVTAEKSTPVKLTIAPIKNRENGILGGIIIAEDKSGKTGSDVLTI
jgi:PAS domain S-box-containing protein